MAVLALLWTAASARTVYDAPGADLRQLFSGGRACYVIAHDHVFTDTLAIPQGSELRFQGGSLRGPLVLHATALSGQVDLRGASVSGSVSNKVVEASWLCAMDGETDDAPAINQLIDVCGRVHFQRGTYRLRSAFNGKGLVPDGCLRAIRAHIGIGKDNVALEGDEGAVLVTREPMVTVCVFSPPGQIAQSVRNIKIKNLTFQVENDGQQFHEFMHTIKLVGVDGMTVSSCRFRDFWGDAICLGHYGDTPKTGERARNQHVLIFGNTIVGGPRHSNRNGISVINGKGVVIRGNTIRNTSRRDMPGGIDVEPNNTAYTVEDIVIEENLIERSNGTAGAIGLVSINDGPLHRITVRKNTIRNCTNGIAVVVKTEGTTSHIVITGNRVAGDTPAYNFIGAGSSHDWRISGNTFERPRPQQIPGKIRVEHLLLK